MDVAGGGRREKGAPDDDGGGGNGQDGDHQTLIALPNEVLVAVAHQLDFASLARLSLVDHRLHDIASDDLLWRVMFERKFGRVWSTGEEADDEVEQSEPDGWRRRFRDYYLTPRWHPTERHAELIILDSGLTVTCPESVRNDNRTVRASVQYEPGSGMHYFEVTSLCPNDIGYHAYVGICSTKETTPVSELLMWYSTWCYAYAGNGTLYSSVELTGNYTHLGAYKYGDNIGIKVDYTDAETGWLTFFRNKEQRGETFKITGAWYPCVGLFHPKHAIRIVVNPEVPQTRTAAASEEVPQA